jgi:hypothetical protein
MYRRAVAQPNAFVLFNQWDSLDEEEGVDIDAVRSQHLNKGNCHSLALPSSIKSVLVARDLLVRDLDIVSNEDLESRVFFVSAREAIKQRLSGKQRKIACMHACTD